MQNLGLQVTAAFSDYAPSFTEAIKAVFPHARFQADHCHTVKNLWGHLKKSLRSYRRKVKASGTEQNDAQLLAVAKQLWKWRWSLLKKPANLSGEAKQAMAALEREDAGFVHRFRSIIRQLGNLFDSSHSEAQAKLKLQQLRQEINAVDDNHLHKILTFLTITGIRLCGICGKRGWGSTSIKSNSESGMRLLRRLEKNHDGIRSPATRQRCMPIYQAMKYLSIDIAAFIEQGPRMPELPCV